MARGDQIYVMRPLVGMEGVYEHHGIDCGDGTVIHYSKRGDIATIRRTTKAEFASGQPIYLKQQPVSFIPDIVMQRAESRLGEQQYHLMTNNCEHFANWSKTGRNESKQLSNYGLDTTLLNATVTNRLMKEATESNDPIQTLALFNHANENIVIAQRTLQADYAQAKQEADTWHRAAQLALRQNKEYLARAALERKVKYKQRMNELQQQLDDLAAIATDLTRNRTILSSKVALS